MRPSAAGRLLPAVAVLFVIVGCGGGSSGHDVTSPTPSATPSSTAPSPSPTPSQSPLQIPGANRQLSSIVLTTSEVSQAVIPVDGGLLRGGTEVRGQKTLDECNASYPSEAKRVARIQTGYVARTDPSGQVIASNEVVRYAHGGAQQAYHEIQHALRTCPAHFSDGGKAVGSDTTIEPTDSGLTRDQVTATQMITTGNQKSWSAITFLYDGDLFSGVYVFRPTQAAALAADRTLAAISAKKLAAAVAAEGTLV